MIVKHRGLFIAGWSPTHQQPICVQVERGAKRWPDPEGFRFWYSRQPGSSNYGPVDGAPGGSPFEFVEDPDPIHRAIDRAKREVFGVDLASGADVSVTMWLCPICRTQLAFDGDVCGLCNPEGTPEV